jgi:hypothetical protein
VLVALAACHAPAPTPDAYVFCTDAMPLAPTFANVQRLFTSTCTTCHTTGVDLVLLPGQSYANLVGRMAPNYTDPVTDESCGGLLVAPGNPSASYLYQKVSSDAPCAGVRMPRTDIGTSVTLPACEQALVHDWIAAGAPD